MWRHVNTPTWLFYRLSSLDVFPNQKVGYLPLFNNFELEIDADNYLIRMTNRTDTTSFREFEYILAK
jgi:hypothetical protein